ncbi:MAG: DUF5995 family protein [Acidimicrobiia bacterium]|nr:hypothetical protein [Acidimicrobiia bacterium]MDQ3501338.1 DUF5995 family protein [Actinomycetota bacterium]
MTPSTSLEESLARFDRIIETASVERSHLGVFPAMYRTVTESIRDAVRTGGFFDDDARAEHLTVVFAERYFEAYEAYRRGERIPRCWAVAFEAADLPQRLMILQHLLLGMNAHINFDLGLATVAAASGDLEAVHADFLRVNEILYQVLNRLQGRLGTVSPRLSMLDRLGGPWDERLMYVGIHTCRDLAWQFANRLAESADATIEAEARDSDASCLASLMLRRWCALGVATNLIARVESRDIPAIVDALSRAEVDLDEAEQVVHAELAAGGSVVDSLQVAARYRRPMWTAR